MKETKIQFSPTEVELMCNADIILTKNRVMGKMKSLLEELQEYLIDHAELIKPGIATTDMFHISPKISKGENYLGLPYIILDYPRVFQPTGILAIRTMFWWGHFFSTTLHISGERKEQLKQQIMSSFDKLVAIGAYVNIHPDPWLHHFEDDNYLIVTGENKNVFIKQCMEAEHIKLAIKLPVQDWQLAIQSLLENWKFFIELCVA